MSEKATNEKVINGYKLQVKSVSPLAPKAIEIQYRRANPEPEKPTYEVEAAGGIVEKFVHTPETLSTKEEKETYFYWKEAWEKWQAGLNYKLTRFFLATGVELKLTKAQEKDFESRLRVLELDIPGDSIEKNLLYLEMFVITSPDAMQEIMQAVLESTGIKEEKVEAANKLFRDNME